MVTIKISIESQEDSKTFKAVGITKEYRCYLENNDVLLELLDKCMKIAINTINDTYVKTLIDDYGKPKF